MLFFSAAAVERERGGDGTGDNALGVRPGANSSLNSSVLRSCILALGGCYASVFDVVLDFPSYSIL
jgi:hypothetical protein